MARYCRHGNDSWFDVTSHFDTCDGGEDETDVQPVFTAGYDGKYVEKYRPDGE